MKNSMNPNTNFLGKEVEEGAAAAVKDLKKKIVRKTEAQVEETQTLGEQLKVERLGQKDFINAELKKFDIAESVIADWKQQYMGLTVTDVEDKEGIAKATEAYKLVKNTRITIESKRKELKASALVFGRAVDSEALRLTNLIEPLETHLAAQKNFIEGEKEKVRIAKEEMQKARMLERTNKLLAIGAVYDGENFTITEGEEKITLSSLDVKLLDDPAFNIAQLKCEILHEKREMRVREEANKAKEEAERVAKIAEEQAAQSAHLEKMKQEQDAAAAKLAADMAAFKKQQEDAVREKEKEAEIKAAAEQATKDAELKAAKDKEDALQAAEEKRLVDIAAIKKAAQDKEAADLKAKTDAETAQRKAEQDKAAKELADKLEAERLAGLAPDRDKVRIFIDAFAKGLDAVKYPTVSSDEAVKTMEAVKAQVEKFSVWIKTQHLTK